MTHIKFNYLTKKKLYNKTSSSTRTSASLNCCENVLFLSKCLVTIERFDCNCLVLPVYFFKFILLLGDNCDNSESSEKTLRDLGRPLLIFSQ